MQWLSSISVRRPVFATVLILTLCVVGVVGYRSLGVDKFPKVDFPLVTVTTIYPGASSSSVESDVSEKIEAAVNTVSGLEVLTSISSEGASLVIAQFELEVATDQVLQNVQERVNGVINDLPAGAGVPAVRKADPDAAPVVVLAIKSSDKVRDITRVADTLVRRNLEHIRDVGQVVIIGGQKRQIQVEVDPIRLQATGVSALEVLRAIRVAHVNLPGGSIIEGARRTTIRIDGRVGDPALIGDIVVRQVGDNPIRVKQVADVIDAEEDAETAAVRDGVSSVVLAVRKQSGTNTVGVVERVKAALPSLQKVLPPGYSLEVVRDNSEQIRTSASQVLEHLVLGSFLAALVVLLFLGSLRSTFIAAIAIPVSIVSTFALIRGFGFTLNMMTLLALARAVGIVIDDAIVVLENIYRFIHERKMKPFPAAIAATKEIGLAVLATTLSLMAVFLPVAFMSGIVGRFLMGFGLTMAFAIAVSLLVSFTLTPMMAARMLPPPLDTGEPRQSLLERIVNRMYAPLEHLYARALGFVLRHRWIIVVACLATCSTVPVLAPRVGFGFLPANDEAQFEIYMRTPEGSSLEATTVIAERIARDTRRVPEVDHTVVTVGDADRQLSNIAKIYVRLSDPSLRGRDQEQVMDVVRKSVLAQVPGGTRAAAQLVNDFSVGTQDSMVAYVITGPDLDRLEAYSQRVLEKMKKVPGVVDLDSSIVDATEESTVRVNLDRAASLGVDPGDVTSTLGVLIGGVESSSFEEKGEQYPVRVRATERFRGDLRSLSLLTVPSRTLGQVPLIEVVSIDKGEGPSQIVRTGRARSVSITCNVAPGFAEASITAALRGFIDDLGLPPGYKSEPFGRSKEAAKVNKAFAFAFLLSFIFMYLVLAAQFESWIHPFVIMLALPLTFPFALMSLLLFGQQLNIFSMLGLLVLFGMVKKNSILQVDHTNQLRARGMPRNEAILQANRERLRPILMTTLAFVAGMLPLVFSHGIGAGFSRAMAGIVVGGQMLSLLLTLLAIPVFYSYADDIRAWAGRMVRRVARRGPLDRGADQLSDSAR
jgi:hydrophobe/amphiphile efflux-1 (HAE1) family protein